MIDCYVCNVKCVMGQRQEALCRPKAIWRWMRVGMLGTAVVNECGVCRGVLQVLQVSGVVEVGALLII